MDMDELHDMSYPGEVVPAGFYARVPTVPGWYRLGNDRATWHGPYPTAEDAHRARSEDPQ